MNEFEKLEAELKELRPLPTSEEFTGRLERALGDAGKVAMRCLPDEDATVQKRPARSSSGQSARLLSLPRLAVFAGLTGLGLAAAWAVLFYLSSSLVPDSPPVSAAVDPPFLTQKTSLKFRSQCLMIPIVPFMA